MTITGLIVGFIVGVVVTLTIEHGWGWVLAKIKSVKP